MLANTLLVMLGGALGSALRYLTLVAINILSKTYLFKFAKFPLATLTVNSLGSLLIGVLYYFIIKNFDNFDPRLKNFIIVGFLGGFTTFSAFSLDVFRLVSAGNYTESIAYILISIILPILGVFFGFYLAKIIF